MSRCKTSASRASEKNIDVSVLPARKPESSPSKTSPSERILHLQRTIGNQAVGSLLKAGTLQAKLKIGQPNDHYEQEADRVAEQVMRMPDPALQLKPGGPLTKYLMSAEKDEAVQSKEWLSQTSDVKPVVDSTIGQLNSSVQALTEPRIQRKLLVTGKTKDVKALLDLLEPASGFKLKYVPKTHEVSISSSKNKPRSAELASRLKAIIDDTKQDAELSLGRNQQGVGFGKFPGADEGTKISAAPVVQVINLADIEAIEAGSPGSGVALFSHELVENYDAHNPAWASARRSDIFALAHDAALEAERVVAGELVSPGGRVADMDAPAASGDIRSVLDYENYYLVYDHHGDRIANAQKVGRVKVSTNSVTGFKPGSFVLPTTALSTIKSVVSDLETNPFATVRVEGAGNPFQDKQTRMAVVREAILRVGNGHKGFDIRSWRNFHLVGNGSANFKISVEITVERPDI